MKVINLFDGDQRYEVLLQSLESTLYERGEGLPIPAIIGVLEILKKKLLEENE
jgi:hypothetical protein